MVADCHAAVQRMEQRFLQHGEATAKVIKDQMDEFRRNQKAQFETGRAVSDTLKTHLQKLELYE